MSLNKSAATRLSLLAGSSLVAAVAAGSLLAVPTAAIAAQNPCGETPANDGVIVCPVATYPTGIEHTSAGDLDVTVQTGSNFGTGGVVSTAGGAADDLTLRLTGSGTSLFHAFNTPFPALLNAQSQSGDVLVEVKVDRTNISTAPIVSANNAATTRAVRAVSTAGGDVTVMNLSVGNTGVRSGTIQSNTNVNAVAVEATSVGGGDVIVDLGESGRAQGRLYGILAQADGAGAVSITGTATASTSDVGTAGLRVVAGTGPVTITGEVFDLASPDAFNGRTGVYIDTGGDVTFSGRASGTDYGLDIVDVAAGTTATINLVGGESNGGTVNGSSGGIATVRAAGAGTVLVNVTGAESTMNFDFTGMSAPVVVDVNSGGKWMPQASQTVPDGNFSINIASDGAIMPGLRASGNDTLEAPVVVTFAGPSSSLTNAGRIVVGRQNTNQSTQVEGHEAEFRLVGLEEFRHSGTILLGSDPYDWRSAPPIRTDRVHDDMFVFEDGGWIGEGGTIVFDVDIYRSQTNCDRAPVTNSFAAADCVRIIDSTVEGVTYVSVNEPVSGDRGRMNQQLIDDGILLIDAPGSTVTADNFALDPNGEGYNPDNQSFDKGLYQYVLLFDEDASQFKLFPTLSSASYQLPMAATAAHNLWRVSTGSWLNRQADLRGSLVEGLGGGVWIRASGEQADRDIVNSTTLGGGLPFSVDSSHRADTYAITGGLDLLSGSDGHTGYVVGVMAGYGHTDIEYDASVNTQAMDAWTAGVYGGLVVGQLFVDAVVNANNVIIDTDAPGFNFSPEGTILSSRMVSLGGQVEAGWRLLFEGGFFAEPLASVSYVRSKMDDLQIVPADASRPGLAVSFEDPSSFRAGVGARFGVDADFAGMRTQVSLLARTWNDLEGQNTASIHNLAFPDDPDFRVVDEFSGQFNEVAVGASLWAPNGAVSAFLNLGGKFGDDYNAKTGSVGVRVAW